MNFELALAKLMHEEGYYSFDPDDTGGETKWGISKQAYPHIDIANMKWEDARKIYCDDYWDALKCDAFFNNAIAWELFDFGVNAGIRKSARVLQEALCLIEYPVAVDQVIGADTILQANKASDKYPEALLQAVYGFQFMHYYGCVLKREKNKKFIRGWLKRIMN